MGGWVGGVNTEFTLVRVQFQRDGLVCRQLTFAYSALERPKRRIEATRPFSSSARPFACSSGSLPCAIFVQPPQSSRSNCLLPPALT